MKDVSAVTWLGEHRVDGKTVARIGRRGCEVVAEFPGVGTLFAAAGAPASFHPAAGANPSAVEKLNLGLIDALIRHREGGLTLHGSCASLGSRAVALLGPSGSGKSTLVAALCAVPNVKLVADDTVAIESSLTDADARIQVRPTQTVAWLLPSARMVLGFDARHDEKFAVPLSRAKLPELFLVAIVGLAFDAGASATILRRLHGQEAFSLLSRSAIRLMIDDPAAQEREFDQLSHLAQRCDIFELRRPRSFSELVSSVQLIRKMVEADWVGC
jgi:energy-coupling factor transporter ATP-binding protein EcfA2